MPRWIKFLVIRRICEAIRRLGDIHGSLRKTSAYAVRLIQRGAVPLENIPANALASNLLLRP